MIALVVSIAVLAMGIGSELLLRQSFVDHTRIQLLHAFQRLDASLHTVESDLMVSAQLASQEDSLIASIQLINQYQDKARYNAVLIDEEKKQLAKSALDRVKFSQSSDLAIYDKNDELLAFASRKAGAYQMGYISFAGNKEQTYSRAESEVEFVPAAARSTELHEDRHVARQDNEKHATEPVISYQRQGSWLVVKSHQNIWDPVSKQRAGHLEFSYVVDDGFLSHLSSDLDVRISLLFEAPKSAEPELLNKQLSLESLQTTERNGMYMAAVRKGTLNADAYFTAEVSNGNEDELISRQRRQTLLTLVAIGVGLLVAMNQLFKRNLVLPLGQLMRQIHEVKGGHYSHLKSPATGDEIEEVGHNISSLAATLLERETELRRSENRSRVLAEVLEEAQAISQLGSWTLDFASGGLKWSAQLYRLLSLDPAVVKPTVEVFLETVHPDDQKRVRRIYANARENLTAFTVEHRLTSSDDRPRWVSAQCRFETDASGEVVRAIGTVQDITERKLAEIALADSNNLLMTVIDSIPLRVFWKDHQLNYLGCNTVFAKDAGKTGPEEVIGKNDFQMGWAAQAELYRADDRHLIDTGSSKLNYEEPQTTPDGHTIWLRTSKISLKKPDGQVFGLVGIYEDITERREIEEQLRKLSQVAEQSPESIVITGLTGEIEYVNTAYQTKTGYSFAEVLGRNPNILKSDLTPPGTYAEMWRALKQGQSWSGELINKRKDGSVFTEWAVISPLRNAAGNLTHYVAVQEDITEKKRIATELDEYRQGLETLVEQRTLELTSARQQADESNRAKSEFLANMSHEIRTPMNGVLGLAYLLAKADLPADAMLLVRKLQTSGRTLQRILDDILDYSKLEAAGMSLEIAEFDLQDVINSVCIMMEATAASKKLELAITPPPRSLSRLKGDQVRLSQVLTNLVVNAIKFTAQGFVSLAITVVAQDDESVTLHFEVQDSGIGISSEQVEKLFVPFQQADVSTTRKYGGTGLGLSISKRLLEMMDSTLEVKSALGEGSTFHFTLTLPRGGVQPEPAEELTALEVVIADDSEISRQALAATAESLGWHATALSDGHAAVRHITENANAASHQQVVILDWQMPGIDGPDTAKQIQEKLTGEKRPIVLVVTAFSREELTAHPGVQYADAVLTKPVTPTMLFDAVDAANRQRKGLKVAPAHAQDQRLKGLRLLLVDDSEVNREVGVQIFAGEGAHVELAEDGQQAYDWLVQHPNAVDIVLMDIQMPVLDGYSAMTLIRQQPALNHIPVVALTAGVLESSRNAIFACGMVGHISKPMDVSQAVRTILSVCKGTEASTPAPLEQVTVASKVHPGLDVQQSLQVWRDEDRYRHYLARFADEYAQTFATLKTLARPAVKAFAHKLTGAAGNMGLMELSAAASQLEAVAQTDADLDNAIARLKQNFDTGMDAVRSYLGANATLSAPAESTINLEQAAQWMQRIDKEFDSLSPDVIAPLLEQLQKHVGNEHQMMLRRVFGALDGFDFRGGRKALRELASAMHITLDTSNE